MPEPFPQPLPLSLTALIGRSQEIATIVRLLQQPAVRLLTLTGPGGVGKTRLALQVAQELQQQSSDFVDGTRFIALAAVSDPVLVLPTIAQSFDLRDEGRQTAADQLQRYLATRRVLLVLDNFEQVIEAAPRLLPLLAACTALKLLVTSRESLRVRGEHEFTVPLLPLPALQPSHLIKSGLAAVVSNNPAILLFSERARAVTPNFQLTDENAAAIAELCTRLDGLPLALELAAARTKLFSPQALLTQFKQATLPLLTGGARDLPARQQTLYQTIQWSYDLLNPTEQQLLRSLVIFVGGFTLEAVQAVSAHSAVSDQNESSSSGALIDTLTSLVDKSLVQRSESQGEPRFSLLVMVREFGLGQLQASNERLSLGQAHADYYLHLIESAEPQLKSAAQHDWLTRLAREHDNLRAALRFVIDQGQTTHALRLGCALTRFWLMRGYVSEGEQWLKELLALPQRGVAPTPIAAALCAASDLSKYRGDLRQAMTLGREGLRLFQAVGDAPGHAEALHSLAQTAMRAGRFDEALALHQESLALHRQLQDEWGIARDLVYLGLIHWTRGDYATARPLAEEGLIRCRNAGDPQRIAQALQALGWIVLAQNELPRGQTLFAESLTLCRQARDIAGLGRALPALAWIATEQGDGLTAHQYLSETWAILRELGDRYHLASCISLFSHLALFLEQPLCAVQLLGAVETLRSGMSGLWPVFIRGQIERNLTRLAAQLGENVFATAWAEGQTLTLDRLPPYFPTLPAPPATPPPTPPATYPAGLTEREVEVLRLLAQGLTNAQIAEKLIVSPYTVNAHLRTIYGKLEVPTRAAATRFAIDHKLV